MGEEEDAQKTDQWANLQRGESKQFLFVITQ